MSIGFTDRDVAMLRKLNRRSQSHTFSPDRDVDWDSYTTPEEFRELYNAWSLLLGTRYESSLNDEQRIRFAQYQQTILMMGTALFEHYALANIRSLFGDDNTPEYQEYISHLIKEESCHYVLFTRAVARIQEAEPMLREPPSRPFRMYFSFVLFLLRHVPLRRFRHRMFFFLLHFVEDITLQASSMTRRTIKRRDSLVLRVWELHAIDEARHVAFDDVMMNSARLPGVLDKVAIWLTLPLCIGASMLINLNEIWAAKKLGVPVGYLELPKLMKRTTAPFKRKVFRLLSGSHRQERRAAI